MLNNGYAAFVWVRAPSLCLLSDTLLNEDALPHRSRREQGAGGHPVLSTGIVCVCVCVEIGGRDGEGYCRCSIKLGVSVCACEERTRLQLHNGQRRNKHPPHNLPTSLQWYLVPICVMTLCLTYFLEDRSGHSTCKGIGGSGGKWHKVLWDAAFRLPILTGRFFRKGPSQHLFWQ